MIIELGNGIFKKDGEIPVGSLCEMTLLEALKATSIQNLCSKPGLMETESSRAEFPDEPSRLFWKL
jgi:hypothetical protein